jgi:peptidoglycan/LPS O-acetylase OafA/YrhL
MEEEHKSKRLIRLGVPNNFDAIRMAMALLVVWSHSFALYLGSEDSEPISRLMGGIVNAGNVAVYVFFIVSGFLIAHSFERSGSPWSYLRKRVARIYPGYLAATSLCAFVLLPLYAGTHYTPWTAAKTLWMNLLLKGWFVEPGPFVHNPVDAINGALWSIPFEFWCYLGVLALGVLGLLKAGRRILIAAALLAVIALHVWADATGRRPGGGIIEAVFGWPYQWLKVLPCFLAGTVAYLYRDELFKSTWIALCGVLALIISSHLPGKSALLAVDVFLPLSLAYATFYLAFSGPIFPVSRYGDFSYGTYLYGYPCQQLLFAIFGTALSHPAYVILSVVVSLTAGVLSWFGVERWFLRRQKGRVSKQDARPAPVRRARQARAAGSA